MTALAIGLLGSGEFEPWAEAVDRWLLARATIGDGSVLVLPTAAAPEGDDVFETWAEKGLAHYGRLGVQAEVVPLKTRDDASDERVVAALDRASMVFFSGGNPAYLASTLVGTKFWEALVSALARGLAYAGCSAGAACLGDVAPDTTVEGLTAELWRPGLGFFPGVYLGPHWDALDTYVPGLRDFFVSAVPTSGRLVAIDERTAIVGDGASWSVMGSGAAHLLQDGAWRHFASGEAFVAGLVAQG